MRRPFLDERTNELHLNNGTFSIGLLEELARQVDGKEVCGFVVIHHKNPVNPSKTMQDMKELGGLINKAFKDGKAVKFEVHEPDDVDKVDSLTLFRFGGKKYR